MKTKAILMDTRAVAYVQSELQATNRLGRLVLSTVDMTQGFAVAFVPEEHTANVYAFRSGIFVPGGRIRTPVPGGYLEAVPSTEDALTGVVHGILGSDTHRVIVCESFLLREGDLGRTTKLPRKTGACGEFVYHWASHGDGIEDVRDVVKMTLPVPLGVAVISTLPPSLPERLGSAFNDPSVLPIIAEGTESVLVGAYHGESVVAWVRSGASFGIEAFEG